MPKDNSVSEAGVIDFGSGNVPVATPHEESEELDETEQAQLEALKKGEDPTAVEAPEAPEEPEAPAEEATPEAEAAPAEAKPKREVRVPLSEVQKEREKRQTLEKELADLREQAARADERWKMVEAAQQAAAQPQPQGPEPEPDRELDPIGWQDWKIRRQDEWLNYLYQQSQQQQAYTQQNQYATYIQSSEAQFASEHPEYFPTINKLQGHLDMMFSPIYPDAGQRRQVIAQWTQQTIQSAIQAGRNPAAVVYEVAKNAGLTEREAQQAAAETEQVQRVTSGGPSIQQRQQAQRASRTLSNVAGTAPKTPPTNREIADMSEEEWELFRERFKGDPLKYVVGNQR